MSTEDGEGPRCAFDKILGQCADQCPVECGMTGPSDQCPPPCISGCFCRSDLYQFGELCLPMDSCPGSGIVFGRCSEVF